MKKNVFISHASEDKETIVIPFAKELERYGISYWLDINEIIPGDRMSEKIFKEGIANSEYFVVFISKKFLNKGWTNEELRNALTRQIRMNTNTVIPFLVDIEFTDLINLYPELENIFCGNLKNGIPYAAYQLNRLINGQIHIESIYFQRHEILSVLNWYKDEFIEKLYNLSYEQILELYNPRLTELLYSFIFAHFSEQQQQQFLEDRLNTGAVIPTESFFQISLAINSGLNNKYDIISKILRQYPKPQKQDFESVILPQKEISFFQTIEKGDFIFGANENDEYKKDWISKAINVNLDAFEISSIPITNELFELFAHEHYIHRLSVDEDLSKHPVVNVNWYEASMFVIWLSQVIHGIALPTEYEWEKAASWSDDNQKRRFPWGDKWEKNYCNSWYDGRKNGTTQVGHYEQGKSGYGLYDMCGNVWEWCSDWFSDDWSKFILDKNVSNPRGPLIGNRKVDRGGGWYKDVGMPTVYMRAGDCLTDCFQHCGFRIVKRRYNNG